MVLTSISNMAEQKQAHKTLPFLKYSLPKKNNEALAAQHPLSKHSGLRMNENGYRKKKKKETSSAPPRESVSV